ncbi:MAG: ferritin-like domain-containing protein [Chloroflexi bacterium]|nr:ferritin-like domain-containing protein [Chloroflexota bacterium]
MDKQEIIELLRADMRGEHQAIIQYLFHAYGMAEGEVTCEVEAIAREEMRHFDWLADAIIELGGDPTLEREPVDFTPGSPQEMMAKDVGLEQVAIDQYRDHIERIDDPAIRRLLARILHDELVHKGVFQDLIVEAEEQGLGPAAPAEAKPPERLAEILNQGIRHEYTVILQYLYHAFVAKDKELAEELEMSAINEMQHMGWLAEALAGRGGKPDMSHTELFLSRDPAANLEADIAVEQEVTGDYSSQIPELQDQELIDLVERIRDHEIYHDAVFKDLLEEVRGEQQASEPAEPEPPEEKKAPRHPPTVGSLKK